MLKSIQSSTQLMATAVVGIASITTVTFGLAYSLSQEPHPTQTIVAKLDCDPINDPSGCTGL